MKKYKSFKLVFFTGLVFSTLTLFSCKNKNISPIERERITNDSLVLAQKNQDILLSFKGIVLGASLKNTIDSIKKDTSLNLIYYSNEKCEITTKLITYHEDIIPIKADIYAYKDKIFIIKIETDEETVSKELKKLYSRYYSKMGSETHREESPWENEKADYTKCKTINTESWDFRNQRLEITINGIMTQERYIKDATKEYYENRYGTRHEVFFQNLEIKYIDKYIYKEYELSLKREEEEMKLSQRRTDSLDMERKKIEAKEKEQRVQNAMKKQLL